MHPLHQAIKEEEAKRAASEALMIPFLVPIVLCYLVAALFPFLVIYIDGDRLAFAMLSILNAIVGAAIGVLGACVFAWKRNGKVALRFLISGLALWLFAVVACKFAFLVCGVARGEPVIHRPSAQLPIRMPYDCHDSV
jgi:membrane associated rhomboid family serine protease